MMVRDMMKDQSKSRRLQHQVQLMKQHTNAMSSALSKADNMVANEMKASIANRTRSQFAKLNAIFDAVVVPKGLWERQKLKRILNYFRPQK